MSDRPHVLIIDDDPLFRNIIVAMLRRDFVVSTAAEGSEGYFKALEHKPHAALVDIHMPGWDGLKTIDAIRKHPAAAGLKIIVLTADSSQSTLLASMQAGADDYLLKTRLSREGLVLKLEQLLPGIHLSSAADVRAELVAPGSCVVPAPCSAVQSAVLGAASRAENPQALQTVLDCWE